MNQQSDSELPQFNFNEYSESETSFTSENFSTDVKSDSESSNIFNKDSSDWFFTETLKALATDSSQSSDFETIENDNESRNSMMTVMTSI